LRLGMVNGGDVVMTHTGGWIGSVRRKHKAVRKATAHDDKRLKACLQRLQCRDIPAIVCHPLLQPLLHHRLFQSTSPLHLFTICCLFSPLTGRSELVQGGWSHPLHPT
jgi:hypothetical protein